jgi:hypothetical protein
MPKTDTTKKVCVKECPGSYYNNPLTDICVEVCPADYNHYEPTRECIRCDISCKTCDGPARNQCLSCGEGETYLADDKRCSVLKCAKDEYPFWNKTAVFHECGKCSARHCPLGCYTHHKCKKPIINATVALVPENPFSIKVTFSRKID